jgi:hypothetical protein
MNRPGGRSAARGAGPCRAQLQALPNCQYLHGDRDANGQTLAYVYGHADERDAELSKSLTLDEARPLSTRCGGQGVVIFYGMAAPVRAPQIGPARSLQ